MACADHKLPLNDTSVPDLTKSVRVTRSVCSIGRRLPRKFSSLKVAADPSHSTGFWMDVVIDINVMKAMLGKDDIEVR